MMGVAGHAGIECPVEYSTAREPAVLFLHGYSFRHTIWVELGYTRLVEEMGHSYAAPDMPYGRRTGCSSRSLDVDVNLGIARDALRLAGATRPAIVVAASMGCRYAVYLAASGYADSLVLAAPALGSDEGAWSLLRGLRIRRAVVVWGSRDRVVPRREAELVAKRLGAELVVARGAGHVVYRDDPDLFSRVLRDVTSTATSV